MIIFAVQTNLAITKKPEWLEAYRAKYHDLRYDYHVTLKQPCIIDEQDLGEIRHQLADYFDSVKPRVIKFIFDQIILADTRAEEGEACIMIKTTNEEIEKLQKDLMNILSRYTDYVWEQSKEYEANFMPHITISRDMNRQEFESAKSDLKEDYLTEGVATKVILSVVRDFDKNDRSKGYHDDSIYNLY